MSAFKVDGDFNTASATGPKMPTYPFSDLGDITTIVYSQPFMQKVTKFKPLARSSRGDFGSYLVDESEPNHVGGEICTFSRTYAMVPLTHNTFSSFVYNYQIILGTALTHDNADTIASSAALALLGPADVIEYPQAVMSFVVHDYFYAPGASSLAIPMGVAARIVRTSSGFKRLGGINGKGITFTSAGASTKWRGVKVTLAGLILAEDSVLQQWKGDIYERLSRYVPTRVPI